MAGYWDRWKTDDENDPYVRWTGYGDTVEGVITKMGSTNFGGDSETKPVLTILTRAGVEKILNVSQKVLLNRMAELCPEVGDHIKVVYTGEATASMPGRNPAKLFEVTITPKSMMAGDDRKSASPAPAEPDPAGQRDWSDEPF